MEIYLVPTDFSQTSINAAKYAAQQSTQTSPSKIILLHSYYVSEYETLLPSADFTITTPEYIIAETEKRGKTLEDLKVTISELAGVNCIVETHISAFPVIRAVHNAISDYEPTLVVIGTNGGDLDNSDLGSNALVISKTSPIPVLVVPPQVRWQQIKRVVLACDLKKVKEVIPLKSLKKIFDTSSPVQLLVLNICKDSQNLDESEHSALQEILAEFNPQYFFREHTNVLQGIVEFTKEQHAQIVIALPKKYSFFTGLLHTSLTEQLADHLSIPVLLLKDN
ncbi:universal stress protein [Pedobacter sp. HMF7647]|uniref:Universal stress protein n=1 Tax=Hufsiella arboris TaxID=2695275 RepID=A0A7K1Y4V6_9SPHI|nr:universal stress protein [Hufsiella arboris]MXV49617.1 universal stress protein [Hufsiella arboris]